MTGGGLSGQGAPSISGILARTGQEFPLPLGASTEDLQDLPLPHNYLERKTLARDTPRPSQTRGLT